MKRINKIVLGLLVGAFTMVGCDNLLDVDSDRIVFPKDNHLDSPNDTIYSMLGIISKVQKVADRYVVLGELRGDLLDLTQNSSLFLEEINNFNVSSSNPYTDVHDYYAVINNCNYLIEYADTSIVAETEKVMYKQVAAAKTFRAWTYLQLMFNYGSAIYYEEPLLTIADAEKGYPTYYMDDEHAGFGFNDLADVLIEDLEPWKDVHMPGGIVSNKSFIPIKMLLGDLYLWKGEYEKAALEYRNLMFENKYLLKTALAEYAPYQSYWEMKGSRFDKKVLKWNQMFSNNNLENEAQITILPGSLEYGQGADLDTLARYRYEVTPSRVAIQNWNDQIYFYDDVLFTDGDLRGDSASYYSNYVDSKGGALKVVGKTFMFRTEYVKVVPIYRVAMLYLRYAEAVNRAGKPNLAFATLKNGLNIVTTATRSIVPASEITESRPAYMNFDDNRFVNNIGVHALGCGNTQKASAYKIPAMVGNHDDSIKYVEDLIVQEYALETAFEGNRFQDLMRVAIRRQDKDNSYLARMVAKKHEVAGKDYSTIYNRLLDKKNWFLPQK